MNRNSFNKEDKIGFADQNRNDKSAYFTSSNKLNERTYTSQDSQNQIIVPNYSTQSSTMPSYKNKFSTFLPPYPHPSPVWSMYPFNPSVSLNSPSISCPPIPFTPQIQPPNICSVPPVGTFSNEQFLNNLPSRESEHFRSEKTFANHEFSDIETTFFPNRKINSNVPQLQLCQFSSQIREYYRIIKSLEKDLEILKSRYNDEPEEKWNLLCEQINKKQTKLKILKISMNLTPSTLRLLRCKLNKRKKRRKLAKEKRLSQNKMPSKYEIAELHMQQLVQNAHKIEQEQILKKEADSVLSSVLQKKSAARNQINLLTAVLKLHSARLQSQNMTSHISSNTSVTGFRKIIEKLKTLWETQVKEYEIEENGLRIMLKESAVNAEDEECRKLKRTFGKWLNLIFGTTDFEKDQFYSDIDQFIEIRRDWDKYVIQNLNEGSKIPPGWIVPKYNSNDSWSKFINE